MKKYDINTIHKTEKNEMFKVISKTKKDKRVIKFLDEFGYECEVSIQNFKNIKNPFTPSVCGVGYLGDSNKDNKSFTVWRSMLCRCYNEKFLNTCKTYKGTEVSEIWHSYLNFKNWFDSTYPKDLHLYLELDKDLMQQGIKNKVYSPNTCVWLPKNVNSFLTNKRIDNSTGYIGVSWSNTHKKFTVQINVFGENKRKSIGNFSDAEEASTTYKNARTIECEKVKKYLRSLNYLSEDIIQLIE